MFLYLEGESMKEENHDLFGFEELDLNAVENAIESDESKSPETLRQIYALFRDELDDQEKAVVLLGRFCKNFGGLFVYVPKGKKLEVELQNLSIWNEFKGNNAEELAKKYDISVVHVYRVIKAMRRREMDKQQPSLF